MDGHLSYLLGLLKNEQKSDSFSAHFEQHFNATTSLTYLRKYMTLKVVNQLKSIWQNEETYKTKLQPINGGTFNNPLKGT